MTIKVYFAGSISGGRKDSKIYGELIKYISMFGTVLTEHIGDLSLGNMGESKTNKEIFDRDVSWIKEANLIIAEVSTPSLGVGYELGLAESLSKKILCLYRPQEGKRLSAMVSGNSSFQVIKYSDLEDVKNKLKEFFSKQ